MEIVSYNWGDESSNQIGICLRHEGKKVMVWSDGDDYEFDGVHNRRYQNFGGGGFTPSNYDGLIAVAYALGEALQQMIGGYR